MVLGLTFNILPGSEWSAIMLTYGFPLAIIGMALKVRMTTPSFTQDGLCVRVMVISSFGSFAVRRTQTSALLELRRCGEA